MARSPTITIEMCKALAAKHNGRCLSETYTNKRRFKVLWKCENDRHKPFAAPHNIVKKGHWCKSCSDDKKRKDISICHIIAEQHNGQCLSEEYVTEKAKMLWACDNPQHKPFMASYVHIKTNNRWCSECRSDLTSKEGIAACNIIAEKAGFECLSDRYVNCKTLMPWRCSKKHIWRACFGSIFSAKSGCPYCSRKNKKTIDDCHIIAESNGGQCLDSVHSKNEHYRLSWQCACGFIWKASYNSIQSGSWCPQCNKAGRPIRIKIQRILQNIFPAYNIKVNSRPFDWLVGSYNIRLEIDFLITNPDNSVVLAIEYDGEQHFMPVSFAGDDELAKKEFELTKQRDALKDSLIAEHSDEIPYFIRVPYTVEITEENVTKIIENYLKEKNTV